MIVPISVVEWSGGAAGRGDPSPMKVYPSPYHRPGPLVTVLEVRSVAEVDVGQDLLEPLGGIPAAFAEQRHGRWDEHHPHDRGVEEDRHREGESELGRWDRAGDAGGDERDDHDDRRVGDRPAGARAMPSRIAW